ncbi:MAG: hypothetical protein JST92_08740 [Deltaproteobacteria bacterium]|nr:hypothetical protein [Deltaproteobacteria bacterium]
MSLTLVTPRIPQHQLALQRSAINWLARAGDRVRARQPIGYFNLDCYTEGFTTGPRPFADESRDVQLLLFAPCDGVLTPLAGLDGSGWSALHGHAHRYVDSVPVCTLECGEATGERELLWMMVAGRRGFVAGEGRGGFATGWHDRVRAYWPGSGGRPTSILGIGTCEQILVFRSETIAFADWFASFPGPLHVIQTTDDRLVHSSATLLQHLRRSTEDARALLGAVAAWIGGQARELDAGALLGQGAPAAGPSGRRVNVFSDFALMQLAANECAELSPLLERVELLGPEGLVLAAPPDVVVLSLNSEYAPHFRHKQTGWLLSMHGFRLNTDLSPAARDWLRRDFELVRRTPDDVARELEELAVELRARTGAHLFVINLTSTSIYDRTTNYSWLGDAIESASGIVSAETNHRLDLLAARGLCTVVDLDSLTAEHGGVNNPDRAHPSGPLPEALREEIARLARARGLAGFGA